MFAEVVAALDAGDLGEVRALIAAHPELLHAREENGRADYFARPFLLWYVAENPIRTGALPRTIVAITRFLLDAGAQGCDYALALVVSGRVPRESGVQLELIDALVEAGADPNCLDVALAHRETAAAERLLVHGARLTPVAAVCLDRAFDPVAASARERQTALAGAALYGHVGALRALIDAGVDVNAFNPDDWHGHATALHSAVDSGSREAVDVLLAAGADPRIRDTIFGATAPGWATYLGRPAGVAWPSP